MSRSDFKFEQCRPDPGTWGFGDLGERIGERKFVFFGGHLAVGPPVESEQQCMHEDLTQELERRLGRDIPRADIRLGLLWLRSSGPPQYELAYDGPTEELEQALAAWLRRESGVES